MPLKGLKNASTRPRQGFHEASYGRFSFVQWPRMGPKFKGLMQQPKVPSCWSPTRSNRPWGPNMSLKGPWGPYNNHLE